MVNLLRKNVKWIFSGVGVGIPTLLYQIYGEDVISKANIVEYTISFFVALLLCLILYEFIYFSRKKGFFLYLGYKIKEFFSFLFGSQLKYIPREIKFDCFEIQKYHNEILEVVNKIVCKNQGYLSEFVFQCGEHHKELKKELKSPERNDDKLREHFNELSDKIQELTTQAYEKNVKYIKRYFSDRKKESPRFCIKVDSGGIISDFFRPDPEYYSSTSDHLDNSGCKHVLDKGSCFLCNDIPTAVGKGDYINPRIKCDLVKRKFHEKIDFSNDDYWRECWNSNIVEGNPSERLRPSSESCYRSTLIIPMTLFRNQMSKEFREHFGLPSPTKKNQISRAIYGFACFDHSEINYFDPEVDPKFGYIVSDLLSLYLIYAALYTSESKTYNSAKSIIKELV